MKLSSIIVPALAGALALGTIGGTPAPAKADTNSTAIAAGAAAIIGALLYDGNNHPYYVRNDRRYYVTQQEAQYYRGHHQGYVRQAYVPEQEYPIARNPYQHDMGNHNGNRYGNRNGNRNGDNRMGNNH